MSKTAAATAAQAVTATAPALAAVAQAAANAKPYAIKIHDYSAAALAQCAVHIRNGYVFSPDIDPEFFPANGQLVVTLVLGTPSEQAINDAGQSTAFAIEVLAAEHKREVEAAARRMVEDMQRDEAKAKLDAQIAEQTNALRRLKDQAAKL